MSTRLSPTDGDVGTHVTITTKPGTAARWTDVVSAFGRRGDDPEWCWCRRFLDRPDDDGAAADNRLALQHEIITRVHPARVPSI